MNNIWKDGIYGLVVGDALGVPVEFSERAERKEDPVTDMRAYGTHQQPAGTWSDDSSMTLATLKSIATKKSIDYDNMMECFASWCMQGDFTPFGEVFDIGMATSRAIMNFARGMKATESGGKTEWDNGNGSLMRILPVCLYLYEQQKQLHSSDSENMDVIYHASALTHGHLRSQIACGIYYFLIKGILDNEGTLDERLSAGIQSVKDFYGSDVGIGEMTHYSRLLDLESFAVLSEGEIKSSGYVVHTLEAAVWCLLNTSSYREAVLRAVNLGEDTDTVAAVTGGLAGLYYGYNQIPGEWIDVLQKVDFIDGLLASNV